MLVPGIVLCSARLESSRPAPHKLLMPRAVPVANRRGGPGRVLAPWVITPLQFAGEKSIASSLALPADTTITAPCANAALTASWSDCGHEPRPPRLILITRAGLGFGGTPATGTPAAHKTP